MKHQTTSNQKPQTIKAIKEWLTSDTGLTDEEVAELRLDPRKGVQQAIKTWDTRQQKQKELENQFFTMQHYEREARQKGYQHIAGVDEVGRGPLAGPVVSAAVILPKECDLVGINDSKQLSKTEREKWAKRICEQAVSIHYSIISAQDIDRLNIYQATRLSMKEAVFGLSHQPDFLLVDAMSIDAPIPQLSIIKGDAKSISIAAASIVAKVKRDQLMSDYAQLYPEFGFEHNAGYGTKEHLEGLKTVGATPIHRVSFKPVSDYLRKS